MLRLVLATIFFGTFAFSLQANDTTRLTLLFMGDIMQHGQQLKSALDERTGTYDYHPVFRHISPVIENADLAIANLELTLAGPPYSGYPQFSAPDELAVAVKDAGIDLLVTANNHSLDRFGDGLERTIKVLDSLKIPHTGTFSDLASREKTYPLLLENKGIRIALLNYTYGTNGIRIKGPGVVNYIDPDIIRNDMMKARNMEPDIIIVVMHWGKEYQRVQNKEQEYLAELCFREGANLVIGSHPHVVQPVDWRNESQLVAWSLGNFISNQRKRYTDGGLMLEVEISKTDKTRISRVGHYLSYVHKTNSPVPEFFLLAPGVNGYTINPGMNSVQTAQMDRFVEDSRLHLSETSSEELRSVGALDFQKEIIGPGGQMVKMEHRRPVLVKKPARTVPEKKVTTIVKKDHPVYLVQVLATSKEVMLDPAGYELIVKRDDKTGMIRYRLGSWDSRDEAEQALKSIRSQTGWEDAFIVMEIRN